MSCLSSVGNKIGSFFNALKPSGLKEWGAVGAGIALAPYSLTLSAAWLAGYSFGKYQKIQGIVSSNAEKVNGVAQPLLTPTTSGSVTPPSSESSSDDEVDDLKEFHDVEEYEAQKQYDDDYDAKGDAVGPQDFTVASTNLAAKRVSSAKIAPNRAPPKPILKKFDQSSLIHTTGLDQLPKKPIALGHADNSCYLASYLETFVLRKPKLISDRINKVNSEIIALQDMQGVLEEEQASQRASQIQALNESLNLLQPLQEFVNTAKEWQEIGVPPKEIEKLRKKLFSTFGIGQQDTHEVFTTLSNHLLDPSFSVRSYFILETPPGIPAKSFIYEDDKSVYVNNGSLVKILPADPKQELHIPIPDIPNLDLADLIHLEMFQSYDALASENNKLKCRSSEFRHTSQRLEIDRAPDELIIQLKRFKWDGKITKKNNALVNIEEILEFPSGFFGNGKGAVYRLDAGVCHQGLTPQVGHFIALIRGKKQWFFVNDLGPVVREATQQDMEKMRSGYIFVFTKVADLPPQAQT